MLAGARGPQQVATTDKEAGYALFRLGCKTTKVELPAGLLDDLLAFVQTFVVRPLELNVGQLDSRLPGRRTDVTPRCPH